MRKKQFVEQYIQCDLFTGREITFKTTSFLSYGYMYYICRLVKGKPLSLGGMGRGTRTLPVASSRPFSQAKHPWLYRAPPSRPYSGSWNPRILFLRILSHLPDLCGLLLRIHSPDSCCLPGHLRPEEPGWEEKEGKQEASVGTPTLPTRVRGARAPEGR